MEISKELEKRINDLADEYFKDLPKEEFYNALKDVLKNGISNHYYNPEGWQNMVFELIQKDFVKRYLDENFAELASKIDMDKLVSASYLLIAKNAGK